VRAEKARNFGRRKSKAQEKNLRFSGFFSKVQEGGGISVGCRGKRTVLPIISI